jgi:hypothetical protein
MRSIHPKIAKELGVFGEGLLVSNLELVPGYGAWNTKSAELTFRALLDSDGATDVRFERAVRG